MSSASPLRLPQVEESSADEDDISGLEIDGDDEDDDEVRNDLLAFAEAEEEADAEEAHARGQEYSFEGACCFALLWSHTDTHTHRVLVSHHLV